MPILQDTKWRLRALWRSCCGRRRQVPSIRIGKKPVQSPRSIRALRTSLAKELSQAARLHDRITSARAELNACNAGLRAAVAELVSSFEPSDDTVRRLLEQRKHDQVQYNDAWGALLQAERRLEESMNTFLDGPERRLLSKRARSAAQMFMKSAQQLRRLKGGPDRHGDECQQINERVEQFFEFYAHRLIRSLELLPLDERPVLDPNLKMQREYGMTVLQLYHQAQHALVEYYPTKRQPKPPFDPALDHDWQQVKDDLDRQLEIYHWYLVHENEGEMRVETMTTEGGAASRDDFAQR